MRYLYIFIFIFLISSVLMPIHVYAQFSVPGVESAVITQTALQESASKQAKIDRFKKFIQDAKAIIDDGARALNMLQQGIKAYQTFDKTFNAVTCTKEKAKEEAQKARDARKNGRYYKRSCTASKAKASFFSRVGTAFAGLASATGSIASIAESGTTINNRRILRQAQKKAPVGGNGTQPDWKDVSENTNIEQEAKFNVMDAEGNVSDVQVTKIHQKAGSSSFASTARQMENQLNFLSRTSFSAERHRVQAKNFVKAMDDLNQEAGEISSMGEGMQWANRATLLGLTAAQQSQGLLSDMNNTLVVGQKVMNQRQNNDQALARSLNAQVTGQNSGLAYYDQKIRIRRKKGQEYLVYMYGPTANYIFKQKRAELNAQKAAEENRAYVTQEEDAATVKAIARGKY